MNFENLEEILKMKDGDFEKEAEKTHIIDLNARIKRLQGILKKNDLGMPALIGAEITPKRKKLSTFVHILESVRNRKEKERYDVGKKEKENWRDEYIRNNLRDFRGVIGSAAEHLMHGTFTLDVVANEMLTPQSTEFEIVGLSGNKIKIDLLKLISPSSLNMLIAKAFSPIYFVVEPSGAYQKNKRLGIWNNSGDWAASQGIEYKPQTIIAIMKV